MKVYVTASTENIKDNPETFKKIVSFMKKRGDKNTNLFLHHLLSKGSLKNREKDIYFKTLSDVRNSDLLLAEISYPSISIGFLIEKAINLSIPILCLCDEAQSQNVSTILKRYKSDSFKILIYNKFNIEELLNMEFLSIKKHKVKLNVFLEANLDNFLKLSSTKKGITKSQYLRDIIIEKMQEETKIL